MLRIAFKEWAVVCKALGDGKQSIILRKGGISEEQGIFTPDHTRFWLYPTYVHQQKEGIKPELTPLLEEVQREQPPSGILRLSHFAEVSGVYSIHQLFAALQLDHLHLWSEDTVTKRFEYRTPGLYVLPVRIYRLPTPIDKPMKPEYDGCKTWVDLGEEIPIKDATPVLSDRAFAEVLESLDRLLNPTTLV
jgi:hypothetical protein